MKNIHYIFLILFGIFMIGFPILIFNSATCYDKASGVRNSCMRGVYDQSAIAECTKQSEHAYQMCERELAKEKE